MKFKNIIKRLTILSLIVFALMLIISAIIV